MKANTSLCYMNYFCQAIQVRQQNPYFSKHYLHKLSNIKCMYYCHLSQTCECDVKWTPLVYLCVHADDVCCINLSPWGNLDTIQLAFLIRVKHTGMYSLCRSVLEVFEGWVQDTRGVSPYIIIRIITFNFILIWWLVLTTLNNHT